MSGTTPLTIGGAFNGHTGVVTVPSSLLFGSNTPGGSSINSLLQDYLTGISNGVIAGTYSFENNDLAGGGVVSTAGTGSTSFEEFTNTDSVGGTTAGSGSYAGVSVTAGVTDVSVQVPGNVTLTGVGTTTQAVFGADSNVDYTVTDPAAGSIYLAGGANSISLNSLGSYSANESIYSAGNDSINLFGTGTDYVTVSGNGTVLDQNANASVVAVGSATTNLYWDSANSGGTLNFTNNSSVAATIHIGNFNGSTSSTKVTAFGGAGGGFYVGGASGDNSLVGGTGVVTLVGAGSGDFLEAQSSLGTNVFAQGSGNETLVATSSTGSNAFGAGLNYPGLGQPEVGGIISTAGSGNQQFLLGNVPSGETVYGSTASGSSNNYFVYSGTIPGSGTATVGGGLISIYNFIDASSTIFLDSGSGTISAASITGIAVDSNHSTQLDIALSDGTNIFLKGLTASEIANVHTTTIFGLTAITG